MRNSREKIRPPLLDPDVELHQYKVKDGKLQRDTASPLRAQLNRQARDVRRDIFDRQSTTPEDLDNAYRAAQNFVTHLTGYDTSDVYLDYRTSRGHEKASGTYGPFEHCVGYYADQTDDVADPADKSIISSSVFVHELMHSTGVDTAEQFVHHASDGRPYYFATNGMTLADMRSSKLPSQEVSSRKNLFFEEAFAEEGAARWREILRSDDVSLPRFAALFAGERREVEQSFVEEYRDIDGLTTRLTASAALPAQSIRELSRHTGVDLFGLMSDARDPDMQSAARRELVHAIDSIQPGLYRSLRELEYTDEDFVKGYDLVTEAIAADQTRQLGAVAVAELADLPTDTLQ